MSNTVQALRALDRATLHALAVGAAEKRNELWVAGETAMAAVWAGLAADAANVADELTAERQRWESDMTVLFGVRIIDEPPLGNRDARNL